MMRDKGDQLTFAKWFETIILVRRIQGNMAYFNFKLAFFWEIL